TRPGAVEAIAWHFLRAGTRATAGAAARYARAAAERAQPAQAAQWWRETIAALDRSGGAAGVGPSGGDAGAAPSGGDAGAAPSGGDAGAAPSGGGAGVGPSGGARLRLGAPSGGGASAPGPRAPSGGADARARLEAVTGLGRALAVSGDLVLARQVRAEALDAAGAVGDPW